MNIAIVGGGNRCKQLMKIIDQHTFIEVDPHVIAVADVNDNAPGIVLARQKGLFTTPDYNDFFGDVNIQLIIELTGDIDLYNDILQKKRKNVRAISERTAQLFWEINRVSTLAKKQEQELYHSQMMCKTIVNDLIQEDVLIISHDYRIIDVNESLLNKLGLSREEVIGQPCYKITHRQDHPCSGDHHPCPLIETLKHKTPYQTTHVHLGKNEEELYYSISTYPLIEGDDVIGAIEMSRDITKDINLQKVMMQQEKLASIGRLAAGVAHEINNPMTTILTSAMLFQEDLDKSDPNYDELQTIVDETLRCRRIVTSLLNFARQTKPTKQATDVNAMTRESILLTKKQAAFRDVEVASDLADPLPMVRLDKGQMQQALINLILNGVEASEEGGCVKVQTAVLPGQGMIQIQISDTGAGIDELQLQNIFDPFYTTKDTGTGLGLAITHGIIEQHNGRIDVASAPGKGTTFTILLPIDREHTP